MSPYADRYYKGPSGKWLDALVFGTVELGSMPLTIRAGRHNVYWVETLVNPVHGINYGQAPLDLAKAQATPGIEVKELARPRTQISGQLQATTELSFAAQLLDASRLMCHRVFGLIDAGIRCDMEASMAKAFGTEAAVRACRDAVQLHGPTASPRSSMSSAICAKPSSSRFRTARPRSSNWRSRRH
ncbi:hypothetical protein D9M68_761540 [compost metagenome]